MLSITNHRLRGETSHTGMGVTWVDDNHGGLMVDPTCIVIHYTVTRSGPSTAAGLASPSNKASVHLVLERDGSFIQQVPFNWVAFHAGKSRWRDRESCNYWTIGIEVCNWGPLFETHQGWDNIYGKDVSKAEVVHAEHKLAGCPWKHWEAYTDEQMISLAEVCRLLMDTYPSLVEIVGHDDIAPGRKRDPGPAFPMEELRLAVLGSGEQP